MRTRSEYRLELSTELPLDRQPAARKPRDADRELLAQLMLDAYRGSVDDEGEDLAGAFEAVDHYLGVIDRTWSRVVEIDGQLRAMCFVLEVDGLLYIDPIAVAPTLKNQGLGRSLVSAVLGPMGDAGISTVGAVITDGNTPSERLFAGLGFVRVGAWT